MDRDRHLDDHDHERRLTHQLDRLAPSRRDTWPKDDRRSSSRVASVQWLTDGERKERWPIG